MPKPEVIFICQGNVGRSQMAEAYYNQINGEGQVISAGVDDVVDKYQGYPTREVVEVMAEEGIDVSNQKIKQLSKDMLDDVASIVILCSPSLCPEYLLEFMDKIKFVEIEDPNLQNMERTRKTRDQIKSIVLGLIRE